MKCIYCGGSTHKNGKRKGIQRYVCIECGKWFSDSDHSKVIQIRKAHPDMLGKRYCPDCDKYLPIDEFHNSTTGYKATYCKSCCSHRQRTRTHGLSREDFHQMYEDQEGCCAICGNDVSIKNIKVDHDHLTGEARGLLCSQCNVGIGMMHDNTDILAAAIRYLES